MVLISLIIAPLLCILAAFTSAKQTILGPSRADLRGPVIDDDFSDFVKGVIRDTNSRGLTLAVVNRDGRTELGAWGDRSEDGEKTTVDVSLCL